MFKQLKIENFRCFKYFELQQLGRVNLLVGENNSGKTSVLEAIQIFCAKGDRESLEQILTNRGEYFENTENFDISHLFYGHDIYSGQQFYIVGINHIEEQNIKFYVIKMSRDFINLLANATGIFDSNSKINKNEIKKIRDELEQDMIKRGLIKGRILQEYSLSLKGQLLDQALISESEYLHIIVQGNNEKLKTKFVKSSSLTPDETLKLFNQIVLTPEEDLVYEALQTIEPNIERIAPIGREIKNNNSRSGFYVRLSDTKKRIPIGSMGDGIWRMLGLSLALVSAKDGVLLVDEIDTGLHYTALEDMWKLVWETAKKLNVQVFATTHNSDCWTALETLANREDIEEEDISIQRIEKNAKKSVVFNKKGIAIAAKRGIEVR